VLDVVVITALLYLTGGPTNPFSIFYLVQVVLSAVLLGSQWAWGITVFTTFSFGCLFFWHKPLDAIHSHHIQAGSILSSHLAGMFWAYLLVAALVAYFLDRILREKRASEERAQALVNAQQKLAIITTVTTDAAHRLGTPLATIALVVADLTSGEYASAVDMKEDLALLQHEVMRCKRILHDLCEGSGAIQGESPQAITVKSIITSVLSGDYRIMERVDCSFVDERATITVQSNSIVIALKALLKNAIEAQEVATDPLKKVLLSVALTTESISFIVEDYGVGMDEISLVRIKEPFYSNKQNGMGLGAYIADLVASQLRGSLDYTSSLGHGTRAVLSIPLV
jgi:two-component system sensor histidine kinase RegB